METRITVPAMVDTHLHLRELDYILPLIRLSLMGGAETLAFMPNTIKGLTTPQLTLEYLQRAQQGAESLGIKANFIPIMMLNEETTLNDLRECAASYIRDVKMYPIHRTTHSMYGVRNYARCLGLVRLCGELGIRVHVHPEHPWMLFDNRDAEFGFLSIADMFIQETSATIVWEHGTDSRCIPFWEEMAKTGRFFVTLTAHHLITSEDETFGDVRAVCKPPIKTRRDADSLCRLVSENHSWVMAGTDSAAHDKTKKHVPDCCACGAFTAPFALPLYASALDHLMRTKRGVETFINFTSGNAGLLYSPTDVYNISDTHRRIELVRRPFQIPENYQVGDWVVESFWGGHTIPWRIENDPFA